MKKLIITTICILLASGIAAQISIIGTATPANGWDIDVFMNQDPNNNDIWTLTVELSADLLKFRENGSWSVNWGGTSFPSGYGIPDGPNISVITSGTYFITFNTSTFVYNLKLLSHVDLGISHQAVIRNPFGELIKESPVGIQVSVIQGTFDGSVLYSENHTVLSNANGLITFIIGQGASTDDFSEIDWAAGPHFLKIEADPEGGSNYTIMGITQFLSVPYALFASKSGDQTWNKNANDIFYQNGNVGIGTDSPGAGLHLKGWAFPASFMFLESGVGHDAGFRIYEGDVAKWHIFNQASAGGLSILNAAFHPALFVKQSNAYVGIGTSEPIALLHTYGTGQGEGNVLFTGSRKESGWGDPPVNGPGTRMMWYPDKAAFRVGHVFNNNWDRDSIGVFSVGMGSGSKAWGSVSTALGNETSAGHNSTAMGWDTKALGSSSTAMGRGTIASGDNSTAMGWNTTASGQLSTAMGYQTIASGKFSTVMGVGTIAPSGYETVTGRYNEEYTPLSPEGWNNNDRLFVIGSGTSNVNRSNAITVMKNGNVGIGKSSPHPSAITEMSSANQGFLPPRLTTSQRDAIANPADGLIIFNISNGCPNYYWAGLWYELCGQPFTCGSSTVTDVDGNTYNTTLIGVQCWMKENLKTTHYRNNIPIEYPGTNNTSWENNTTGVYAWYNNDIVWKDSYGALYNWFAVNNSNGLCPVGWHVPTDGEWEQLVNYLVSQGFPNEEGSPNGTGNALKSCRQVDSPLGGECSSTIHPRWDSHNMHHGFDAFDFSSLPGGNRHTYGFFDYVGSHGFWWSYTEDNTFQAWSRIMYSSISYIGRHSNWKQLGLSVRCIKD